MSGKREKKDAKRRGEGKKKKKYLRVNDGTCNAVVVLNRGEMRTPRVFLAFSGAFLGSVVWYGVSDTIKCGQYYRRRACRGI